MKRISIVLATVALALGLLQCKKEEQHQTIEGNVAITLNVRADNGSKINVNPDTGDVAFEYGDVVYVASGQKFVGVLTCNGNSFSGSITNPTMGEPLYFFFLGNKTPAEDLTPGISTSCSVDIIDQTNGKLPVISFAESNETFTGEGAYTAYFLNKAALVKFDVVAPPLMAPVVISGMNNKVNIDFATNAFTYESIQNSTIELPSGGGEKWAIVLPQASGTHEVAIGGLSTEVYIRSIVENDYLFTGIEVILGYVDLGLPSGLLWATCNLGANAPQEYGDYFAWGETVPKTRYDWSTYKYCIDDGQTFNRNLTKYNYNSQYGYNGFTDDLNTLLPEDDAATVNWGNGWRTPTMEDWQELHTYTTHTSAFGLYTGYVYTSVVNGNTLFFPNAGYYNGTSYENNSYYYWSSQLEPYEPISAESCCLFMQDYTFGGRFRSYGLPVRPVFEN